jgi:hypothetical protein
VIAGRILAEVGDIARFATKDTYAAHPRDLNGSLAARRCKFAQIMAESFIRSPPGSPASGSALLASGF